MRNSFLNLGQIINNILHLSPKEAYRNCIENEVVLVDVREEFMNKHKMFDVPLFMQYPYSEIIKDYSKLPKDKNLIFADATGIKSKKVVEFLVNKGYKNIANMSCGIVEWERDRLPLADDIKNRLTGSCMCQLKYREAKENK